MHTKLAHKYTKIKTYWIKYKLYDLRFIRLLKNLFSRNISEKSSYLKDSMITRHSCTGRYC